MPGPPGYPHKQTGSPSGQGIVRQPPRDDPRDPRNVFITDPCMPLTFPGAPEAPVLTGMFLPDPIDDISHDEEWESPYLLIYDEGWNYDLGEASETILYTEPFDEAVGPAPGITMFSRSDTVNISLSDLASIVMSGEDSMGGENPIALDYFIALDDSLSPHVIDLVAGGYVTPGPGHTLDLTSVDLDASDSVQQTSVDFFLSMIFIGNFSVDMSALVTTTFMNVGMDYDYIAFYTIADTDGRVSNVATITIRSLAS